MPSEESSTSEVTVTDNRDRHLCRLCPRACRLAQLNGHRSTPSMHHPCMFPGNLTSGFFHTSVQNVIFITGKCCLKVKGAGELTRMARIWRQNGVLITFFWTCVLKKGDKRAQKGTTRVGLLVDLYSVAIRC